MIPILTSMPSTNDPWRRTVAISVAVMAVIVGLQAAWFLTVFEAPDPLAFAIRDWIQFHRTAERLAAGRISELYPGTLVVGGPDGAPDWFFFFYPPFAAYGTLPLALLSPLQAYLACAVTVGLVTIGATLAFSDVLRFTPRSRLLSVAALVASAPWSAAIVTGHLSPCLLLSPALAFLAHRRGWTYLSGAALGLMMTKPNWGVPLLAMLLIGRQGRMVVGFLATTAVLVLSTAPLGGEVWRDWAATMASFKDVMEVRLPAWKQATLLSTLQSLTGRNVTDPVIRAVWVLAAGSLMVATGLAWWRLGRIAAHLPRLVSVGLLAILAANPYAFFYDALLVVPAALFLFAAIPRGTPVGPRRLARLVFFAAFGWSWIQFFALREGVPSLLGILLTTWAALEVWSLHQIPMVVPEDSAEGGGH